MINKVILVVNWYDPEIKTLKSGSMMATMSIATTKKRLEIKIHKK
ncbi:MAG: hypothetical protein CM15mV66_170 [uncultured marine virus]|nr:MAG: hypothetical protein CM15mV66_170 [uncultured marine virus]